MDEIAQAQAVQEVQNTQSEIPQQVVQSSISETPKKRMPIKKIFNASSWFVFFAFLPLTVLILLSQNTIPGDLFYPIKRSMENVVLAAATVSPSTRAAFRTDLTTRRFDEAEKLLLASSDTQGLKDFVAGIEVAQKEVSAISDPVKKQELQQKIETSVIEYEKRLDLVKAQLVTRENTIAVVVPRSTPTKTPENQPSTSPQTVSPTIEPTSIPLPTNTPVPVPTSEPGQSVIPTNTPVPLPTLPPKPTSFRNPTATLTSISPTSVPTKVPIQTPILSPTSIVLLTATQIPTPTSVPQETGGGRAIGTVDKVKDYLHCLETTQPPHGECTPPEIKSKNFKSENKLEERKEEKPKRDEKPEGRKEGK